MSELIERLEPTDPEILSKIAEKFRSKIVGETNNIKFLTCCCISKDLPRKYRLSAIVASLSSAGKSNLVNNVLKPFSNYVIDYTDFTTAFLSRQKESFDGKILKLEQMERTNGNNQVTLSSLKFLLSEGQLKIGLVDKKEKGNFETKTLNVDGIPVFISTSTNFNIDPESLNRTFLMQVDESAEQTNQIVKHTLGSYSRLVQNNSWKADEDELTNLFTHYAFCADGVKDIVIPFSEKLHSIIPTDDLTIRRDLPKVLNLTCVIAFLHVFRRKIIVDDDTDLQENQNRYYSIIAEPEDFLEALNIAGSTIKQTINKINGTGIQLYNTIRKLIQQKGTNSLNHSVTVREVANELQKSTNRTRELMKTLEDNGYLVRDFTEKEHRYICTDKEFREIKIEDITFTKEEFDAWIKREIEPNSSNLKIREPSCNEKYHNMDSN